MNTKIRAGMLSIVAAMTLISIGSNARAQDPATYRVIITAGPDPDTLVEEFRSTVKEQNLKRLNIFNGLLKKNLGINAIEEYGISCFDCAGLGTVDSIRELNYLFDPSKPKLFSTITKTWRDARNAFQNSRPSLASEDFAVTFNARQGPAPNCAAKPQPCAVVPFCAPSAGCDDRSPGKTGTCDVCVAE